MREVGMKAADWNGVWALLFALVGRVGVREVRVALKRGSLELNAWQVLEVTVERAADLFERIEIVSTPKDVEAAIERLAAWARGLDP